MAAEWVDVTDPSFWDSSQGSMYDTWNDTNIPSSYRKLDYLQEDGLRWDGDLVYPTHFRISMAGPNSMTASNLALKVGLGPAYVGGDPSNIGQWGNADGFPTSFPAIGDDVVVFTAELADKLTLGEYSNFIRFTIVDSTSYVEVYVTKIELLLGTSSCTKFWTNHTGQRELN